MRSALYSALVASVMVAAGCAYSNGPIVAGLVIEEKGPLSGFDNTVESTKVGTAEAQGILVVGWGDASVATAARNGGITRIHHVDIQTLNVFGMYARYRTVVYGE